MQIKNHTNYSYLFPLAVILSIAAFFRIYNLSEQGIIFHDVGTMLSKLSALTFYLSDAPEKFTQLTYIEIKINWILLISMSQWLFHDTFMTAKFLSAILGILTVYLTFLFACVFFDSKKIGLISAMFLSISSYHIFYSRIPISDSFATFLSLLSIFLYLKSIKNEHTRSRLSGIILGFALLTNVRIVFFLVYIVLLEIYLYSSQNVEKRTVFTRYFSFIESIILTVLLYELIIVKFLEISFFYWIKQSMLSYSSLTIDPRSIITYIGYILKYEGLLNIILLFASFFFIKKKYSSLFFILIVCLHYFIISNVYVKYPRMASMILPFLSILYGITIYNLIDRLKTLRFHHVTIYCLFAIILGIGFLKSYPLTSMKTGMRKAIVWLDNHYDPNGRVLSSNAYITAAYKPGGKIRQLGLENFEQLNTYQKLGYKILLLDPGKLIFSTYVVDQHHHQTSHLVRTVEDTCQPIATFDNLSQTTLERFFQENTYPSFYESLSIKDTLNNDAGKIKIYDIESCLKINLTKY